MHTYLSNLIAAITYLKQTYGLATRRLLKKDKIASVASSEWLVLTVAGVDTLAFHLLLFCIERAYFFRRCSSFFQSLLLPQINIFPKCFTMLCLWSHYGLPVASIKHNLTVELKVCKRAKVFDTIQRACQWSFRWQHYAVHLVFPFIRSISRMYLKTTNMHLFLHDLPVFTPAE